MKRLLGLLLVMGMVGCGGGDDAQQTNGPDVKLLRTLTAHIDKVRSVAFSPDGKRIVSGSGSFEQALKIWDASSGKELGHAKASGSVSFSTDGQRIAGVSPTMNIRVWDANSGEELQTCGGHSGSVQSVSFSPDGQRIVSGSDDKTVKIWDASE